MVGIFAVYAFDEVWRVAKILYYGLLSLNHRGQSGCGMALLSDNLSIMSSKMGDVERAFDIDKLVDAPGWAGVGWVLSTGSDFVKKFVIDDKEVCLVSYVPIRSSFENRIVEGVKLMLKDIDKGVEYLNQLSRELRQPITFVAITSDGKVLAYRDPSGLKPLHVGSYGFDLAIVSSESCAIECVGGDPRVDLSPGSGVLIDKYTIERSFVQDSEHRKYCPLEYIYYSRLDSVVDNIPVYDFRRELSRRLAQRVNLEGDVVIGVPETGIVYAIEYAKARGLEYCIGFVQTGRRVRSALVQDLLERLIGVQLKMSPIRSVFKARDVILVDDSLLKGITLKNVVQYLKNRVGARRVRVLVAAPPIRYECPFAMDIPSREELLCANVSMDVLPKVIDAEEVVFGTLEDLYEVFRMFGVEKDKVCTYCMTGSLPEW